jgi:hypothetical protein
MDYADGSRKTKMPKPSPENAMTLAQKLVGDIDSGRRDLRNKPASSAAHPPHLTGAPPDSLRLATPKRDSAGRKPANSSSAAMQPPPSSAPTSDDKMLLQNITMLSSTLSTMSNAPRRLEKKRREWIDEQFRQRFDPMDKTTTVHFLFEELADESRSQTFPIDEESANELTGIKEELLAAIRAQAAAEQRITAARLSASSTVQKMRAHLMSIDEQTTIADGHGDGDGAEHSSATEPAATEV